MAIESHTANLLVDPGELARGGGGIPETIRCSGSLMALPAIRR